MDHRIASMGDDFIRMRLFARLVSADDISAEGLIERSMRKAIRMAETGEIGDLNIWLLELAVRGREPCDPKLVRLYPDTDADGLALTAAIRKLPLLQREAVVLMDVLHLPAETVVRLLGVDHAVLEDLRKVGRQRLRRLLRM